MSFAKGDQTYRAFLRTVGNLSLTQIDGRHVLHFLNAPGTTTWTFRRRHSLLRHFFDYWAVQGVMPALAMPPNRPAERSRFLPYIYSREELHRLLRAPLLIAKANDKIHHGTLRAILLTLYATGATVGEVLQLACGDVDPGNSSIDFSGSVLKARRRIPIGRDLVRVAREHREGQERIDAQSEFFFSKIDGTRISPHRLGTYFERLRRAARISGYRESKQQPCLRDLRATFAVHQITSWIKRKRNLDLMLPALNAYMGNVGLESMERYLQLTPERFRSALDKLSPQSSHTLWRDDLSLLAFLTNL
jgi:site-specific recombinase XerD